MSKVGQADGATACGVTADWVRYITGGDATPTNGKWFM